MPDWLDTPPEVLTALSITVIIVGALMWLIKATQAIQHETKPNSGTSMRDAVDRIERQVERLNSKLDSHIDWHLNKEE